MNSSELADKLIAEAQECPAAMQTMIKTVMETVKNEVKEGRVLLADLLESEEKFFQTLAEIVDKTTNTGIVDPFDLPYIRKFLERILRPLLVRALGDDWIDDLRKVLS